MGNLSQKAMVHIIGAGLSGLSAALKLAEAGVPVTLYEASAQAGGRCRSYYDKKLQREIDNGNHLLVRANRASFSLIEKLQTWEQFYPIQNAYHFYDVESEESWSTIPPAVPKGFQPIDIINCLRLLIAGQKQTLAQIFPTHTPLFRYFIEPLCTAALNTRPEYASATQFRRVLVAMMRKGQAEYLQVKTGFGAALVEPMLWQIKSRGGQILYHKRVQSLVFEGERVSAICCHQDAITLGEGEKVILATQPHVTNDLLNKPVELEHHTIVNGHFLYEGELPEQRLFGVIGSPLQWLMVKPGIISTTTSDAKHSGLDGLNVQEIAELLWRDSCKVLRMSNLPLPKYRVLQERRATISSTPQNLARRPSAATGYQNLRLAGDWLQSPLPATIEASVISGQQAAHWCLL